MQVGPDGVVLHRIDCPPCTEVSSCLASDPRATTVHGPAVMPSIVVATPGVSGGGRASSLYDLGATEMITAVAVPKVRVDVWPNERPFL